MSGWAELARHYRAEVPFLGATWKFQRAKMRLGMQYNNCLTVGFGSAGIYLSTFVLFRVGHPALLVPWWQITMNTGKTLFGQWTKFRFQQAPSVWIRFYGQLATEARANAETFLPNR